MPARPTRGRPYFVMELVKGVPITEYCDEKQLSLRERLELFMPVCQAVQHAHQKGIIHRDIKPSNVLVAEYDDQAVPKVIDFGVAKATGQKLTERTMFTEFGQIIGTVEYMSPEQAELNQLDIDTRSDIYSLGVLLYELLTGDTPFDRKRLRSAAFDEMLRIIREEEPPKPSTQLSSSDTLPSIAANRHTEPARLSKDRPRRAGLDRDEGAGKGPQPPLRNGQRLGRDIERYLNDEPVQACPPSAVYRSASSPGGTRPRWRPERWWPLRCSCRPALWCVSNIRIRGESAAKAKALEAATASQREAQESLKDALAAVDQMLTRVSEERLRDVPQVEPVRRDLLQDAMHFYQKFLEKKSDDPAIRRETALAYCNLGSVHHQLGDYGKAEAVYRKGFAMLAKLGTEFPLQADVRGKLILHHLEFSRILRNQAKFAEAEQVLWRAASDAENLRKEFPDVPLYRDHLLRRATVWLPRLLRPGPTSSASPHRPS